MVCPRCESARIEHCGASIRCAICGLSYDPNLQTKVQPPSAPTPILENLQSPAFEEKLVI